MLLIPTCSEDVTTDMLMPYLGGIDVFRFNVDAWRDYEWSFSGDGFWIRDKNGKICSSANLKCIYLRKPMFFDAIDIPKGGCLENWCREEVTDIFSSLYNYYDAMGKAALVHAGNSKWRKFPQMMLAQKFWKVPPFHICKGMMPEETPENAFVAKTLTQTPIAEDKLFAVKKIAIDELSPEFPWFLQERVEAQEDVTVLYVKGKKFALALDRSTFEGDDYRQHQVTQDMHWYDPELSDEDLSKIDQFMEATGFDFGRFDFLRKDGELYFLELNPNGMWAWMDLEHKLGIFEAVAEEILRCYHS